MLETLIRELKEEKKSGFVSKNLHDCSYAAAEYVFKGHLSLDEAVVYAAERQHPRSSSESSLRQEIENVLLHFQETRKAEEKYIRVCADASLDLSGRESIAELQALEKQWTDLKSQLKAEVIQFLLDRGAASKQLKQLVQQVLDVAVDGDVESRFRADKHEAILGFARRYNEINDALSVLKQEIKNAKDFAGSYGCDRSEW